MVTHDRDLAKRASRTIMLSDGEIIEEFLFSAFPSMTEEQLIRATRNLEREEYSPGQIILEEGCPPDKFYLITRGQIEVMVTASDGDLLTVSRMGRGQYFGEIELLQGGDNLATIRAAPESGVRLVTLDRDTFSGLMDESHATREALAEVAQARVAENINGRNGVDHA
jgi:CRP-like cAMP-binding protein